MGGIGTVEPGRAGAAVPHVTIDVRRPDGFATLSQLPAAAFAAVAVVLYLVAAWASRIWTDGIGPTPLAATAGVVVGTMFVSPRRTWPATLAALAGASVVFDTVVLDGAAADVAVLATARVIGAIAVVSIYAWVFSTAPVTFEMRSVISILAPGVALLVPATLVAFMFDDGTTSRGVVWATWAVGEAMGIIVFAPLFTVLMVPFPRETTRHLRAHAAEAIVVVALVVSVTIVGYASSAPLVLLIIPTLAWLAYRSSNCVAAPAAAFVVLYGTIVTHAGEGPFARFAHPLLWLQLMHAVAVFFVVALGRAFWNDRWGIRRYQAILALQPDAVSIHDEDGTVIETLTDAEHASPLDAAQLAARWDSLIVDGVPARHIVDHDGRTFEVRLAPVSGLVMTVVRDVSDVRRMLGQLERANERWKRLAETAFEGFIEVDADSRVSYVSERWAAMHGYQADEILGARFNRLLAPETFERFAEERATVNAGGHATVEYRHVRPDGERRWVLVSIEGSVDDGGNFAGFVSFAADTTEFHHAVAEREAAELRLASAEQRERERIGTFLHDGPLQTMVALGYRLNTIKTGVDPRTIAADLEHMAMLAVRQMREGLTELNPTQVAGADVGGALERAIVQFRQPQDAEIEIDDRLPADIDMDSAATLFLIGREATINAIMHAGARSIRVTLAKTGTGYRLDVDDDGVGIDGGRHPHGGTFAMDGHLGMRLMQQRAQDAGGTFEIVPIDPAGTRISAWIPDPTPRHERSAVAEHARGGAR